MNERGRIMSLKVAANGLTVKPILVTSVMIFLIHVTFSAVVLPQTDRTVIRETKVMIPMRDGVRLATNIFRPAEGGRFPVVLLRTPYGRNELQQLAEALANRGYVSVWQDVRGRFDSEGEWLPFFHEGKDGDDTIQWLSSQSWSDGQVIMVGGSYAGMVQWLAAKEHNPHLRGLITLVTPGDFYEDFLHEGGAFALGAAAMWSVFVDGRNINQSEVLKYPWDRVFAILPVSNSLTIGNRDPRFFRDWIAHPAYDDYWQRLSWDKEFEKFDFPVLHIGGWFDIFQKGTIENFRRMTTRTRSSTSATQQLIIGAWGHQGQDERRVGEVDFGPDSTLDFKLILSWLDHHFKGENRSAVNPRVRIFTMGQNKWNEYPEWPIPDTRYVNYYFHSDGHANSSRGDGTLTTVKPSPREPRDRYTYDPRNPVPTRGGGNCCWPEVLAWGPLDQRPIEQRNDVLVYSTPPLQNDLYVTGPVLIKLWITSSARDTDFTGKLVDVAPDGVAINLTDGIQRVSYRNSTSRFELIRPGTLYEITIDLWNTSNVFLRGHRLRVEISSSNFPRYSRNLNTGRQSEAGVEMQTAEQTIFHRQKLPSRIVLPILSKGTDN